MGLNHLPSGRFPANGAWLAVQVIAHNLARWTARIGLGEQSTPKAQRRCTLLVVWYSEQEEPWIILTDLAPDQVGPSWYELGWPSPGLEVGQDAAHRPHPRLPALARPVGGHPAGPGLWHQGGGRPGAEDCSRRVGLQGPQGRLLALAYGTRVEDAQERRIAPGFSMAGKTLYLPLAHPLGAPPHFASAPALALGSPVQWRPVQSLDSERCLSPPDGARPPLTRHPAI